MKSIRKKIDKKIDKKNLIYYIIIILIIMWVIKLKIKVIESTHNGDCDDPGDIKTKEYIDYDFIEATPEYVASINNFIELDGSISIGCFSKYNQILKCGNGKCGCNTNKKVISAKIMKNVKSELIKDMTNIINKDLPKFSGNIPILSWEDYVLNIKIKREEDRKDKIMHAKNLREKQQKFRNRSHYGYKEYYRSLRKDTISSINVNNSVIFNDGSRLDIL